MKMQYDPNAGKQQAQGGMGEEMREHRQAMRWAHYTNAILGVWLITSPVTFGYLTIEMMDAEVLRVTAERGLPTLATRGLAMAWSDIISGVLLVGFGLLSVSARRAWAPWAASFVGIWLLFAPLIFWTPSAAAYANDTVIGSLAIAFAVLILGMPGMKMLPGPDIPPGWSYNPSTWVQRAPIIALALVGFFIARYLSAYQLGHIKSVWDPFFGKGTETIITSHVSRAWPVPDAGLGALTYILEALSGFMGDKRRWRTMPWMVVMFGILVIPLGVTSIVFIILQPLVIGTWCTLCLVTALAMLIMISPSLDEVIAMGQFMVESRREGQPFWRTFWMGGTLKTSSAYEGKSEDSEAPSGPASSAFFSAMGLTNVPWTLALSALLGVWLMISPSLLQTQSVMADSEHLVGALVVTFSVIAWGEVARAVRFINILFGVWLVVSPWVLIGTSTGSAWVTVVVGAVLIPLSLPRGKVDGRYGSWDRYIV